MTLLSPVMLLGVLFAAVPLVIHLLNRSRYKVEPFGAMMFLQAAVRERAQAIKLRQILLLLMRMLVFMLLAMALARPVSNQSGTAAAILPTTHVLILDGSYSMQQPSAGATVFNRAVQTAHAILDDMAPHDNALVIWAGNKPRPLQPTPTFDKALIRRSLDKLAPGTESANLHAAIRQGLWALESSNLPVGRLYLLTDQQEYGWAADQEGIYDRLKEHRQLLKVPPRTYVVELPADTNLVNVAPIAVTSRFPLVDTHRRTTFEVDLHNFGDRPRQIRLQIAVDGTDRHADRLTLVPGRTTHRFDHQFTDAGDHSLEVRVFDDDLAVDNTFHRVINVRESIPVLLIEGNTARDPFAASGGLLAFALEASAEPGRPSLFQVNRISHLDAGSLDLTTLRQYRCVILTDVPSVSQRFAFQLEQFAESGGGILFALGERVSPAAYSPLIKQGTGILPAQLESIADVPVGAVNPTFAAGVGSVILANFDLSRTRVIKTAKVIRQWLCQPHPDAVQIGHLSNNPLLLYRDYGRGRVALWTSSFGIDWTNFPVTPDFLPLVHDLVAFLAATPEPNANIPQGAQIVCALGEAAAAEDPESADRTAQLTTPDGEQHQVPFATEGNEVIVRWQNTIPPGIYRVQVDDRPERLFAAMPPTAESDLNNYRPTHRDRLEDALAAVFVSDNRELRSQIATESGVREWWRWLLFATLALLCLELIAGRIFSR